MTRWTIDFGAFRDAWRWTADDQLCGAKTRAGWPCRGVPVYRPTGYRGKARCRMHGGRSTGPRTEAGKAAVAASNRCRAARVRASGAAE
jgi:hypothetical protein